MALSLNGYFDLSSGLHFAFVGKMYISQSFFFVAFQRSLFII